MDKEITLSSNNTEAVECASDKRNCSLLEIANAFKTVALEWDSTHNHSRTLPVATIAHASDAD